MLFATYISNYYEIYSNIFGVEAKNIPAAISVVFCILLYLISNISQLEALKGFGVEARIRNQLNSSKSIFIKIRSIAEALAYNGCISTIINSAGNIISLDQVLESRAELNDFVGKKK